MATMQDRFTAALDWAGHEFRTLSPVTQGDPFTAPTIVVSHAIAVGWNGAALEAIRGHVTGLATAVLEGRQDKRREWTEDARRDYWDELAELRAAREDMSGIHDGQDVWA